MTISMPYIGYSVRSYEQEIVHHVRQLIRIHSAADEPRPGMPFGAGIHRALEYMLELGADLGFDATMVDGYAGHVEFGSGDELAVVLTHVDTVAVGEGWTYPPLDGEVADGRIYGRGASDNKSAAVTALYSLYVLKQAGIHPSRRLRVIFGTNEENGMTDMDYYFTREPLPDFGFVTDGPYPIANAEKGSLVLTLKQRLTSAAGWVEIQGGDAPNMVPDFCRAKVYASDGTSVLALEERGKSAHGAFPETGINAVVRLIDRLMDRLDVEMAAHSRAERFASDDVPHLQAKYPTSGDTRQGGEFVELAAEPFLRFLHERIGFETDGRSLGIAHSDDTHGGVTVNLARIAVGSEKASATLNIRYPVTVDGMKLVDLLRGQAEAAGLELSVDAHLDALYVPPHHPLIGMLSRAYETVTGEQAALISMAGGTYAKKLRGRGVTFGPAFPGASSTRFHQADEHVVIEHMMRHAEVCTQALYELAILNSRLSV